MLLFEQVVASMDWPEVTKYKGLVCAQGHREEIIQDLYKIVDDPQRGKVHSGMIRYLSYEVCLLGLRYLSWKSFDWSFLLVENC